MARTLPLRHPAHEFRLLLFGPFTIYRDSVIVDTGSWQRTALTLLKLLATAPGLRRSRDELINTLWPESGTQSGSSSLRSALLVLRRGLGGGDPSPILYERGWMELNRAYGWEIDLDSFQDMLRKRAESTSRAAELLALYRGEVLPEDRYDDWAMSIRDRIQQLWRDAVLRIVHPDMETGEALAACECLNVVLDSDPYDEEALRGLLEVLVLAGRRTEAMRRYQLFEQQLHADMDLAPDPGTIAIVDRIRARMPQNPGIERSGERHRAELMGNTLSEHAGLPPELTRFVGREHEVATVTAMLQHDDTHLVTLTGAGGAGKTRLALQVAAQLTERFPGGVFFISLAAITDPELVLPTVARSLGVNAATEKSLHAYVAKKKLLLLIDNCEHVIAAAPELAALLVAAPGVKLLVTSREPLHLTAEHVYPVSPLNLPDLQRLPEVAVLSGYESVMLFIERAQAAEPRFEVSSANAPVVAEICVRLDGLPLALELAAARIPVLSPMAILKRMEDRLKLLQGGACDLPARQRTLRGTLDWSHELLNEEERRLFAQLGAFSGGFTIDAAEHVCLADFDTLASLAGKSLVRREGERFAMLETIREYALEKLTESNLREETRRRHAEYYLAIAHSANLVIEAEGEMRHDIVILEHDNVREVLQWARASGEIELGLELAATLENFWTTHSPLEGMKWLSELLERAGDGPRGQLQAGALRAYGSAALITGRFEEGRQYYEASLAEYRRIGDKRGIGIMKLRLAVEELRGGNRNAARSLVEEGLRLHQELTFTKGEALALGILAQVEMQDGHEDMAFTLSEESAALAAKTGFTWWHAVMLFNLSMLLLNRGRMSESEAHAREVLPLVIRMGDRQQTILAVALLAQIAAGTGRPERAGRLWGAVEMEEARAPVGQWETQRDRFAQIILAQTGPEFERGREEGRRLSLGEAVDCPLETVR